MTETNEHSKLKELAKTMLVNIGFKLDEIHEEYRVKVNSFTLNRCFIVDVCGISPISSRGIHKSVAIECGKTSAEKLVNLNLFFDEVYHLPYGLKKLDDFDKVYNDAIDEISKLKETINKQNVKIRDLEYKNNNLKEYIERWGNAVLLLKALNKMLFEYGSSYYYHVDPENVEKILELFLK